MLVLTRKTGETIRVGAEIEVVVLEVTRGKVKLGFAGPRNIPIRRGKASPLSTQPDRSADNPIAHVSCLYQS